MGTSVSGEPSMVVGLGCMSVIFKLSMAHEVSYTSPKFAAKSAVSKRIGKSGSAGESLRP